MKTHDDSNKILHKMNALCILLIKRFGGVLPDKLFIKLIYRLKMHQKLDLNNPKSYTEKLQWLKLYDHNPLYNTLVDKCDVKIWAKEKIGAQYIIPSIGVWNSVDAIDWENLPDKFVIKTTFGGGGDGVFICKNKDSFDRVKTIRGLRKAYRTDPYKRLREWPYKNIPRRIIAEEYLEDVSGDLADYKFYCFDGVPKVLLIATNRFTDHNFDYFDMNFEKLPISSAMGGNNGKNRIEKPVCLEKMIDIAGILSEGFPHVRVDLYCCNGRIYFGEMTFYDSSGYDDLNSEEWNLRFGSWLTLPRSC